VIEGHGEIVIERKPQEILDFVLDLERYRQADTKIGKIRSFERDGTTGTVRYRGKLRGLPTPTDTQTFELVPERSLTFRSVSSLWPGMLARFEGTFECEPVDEGTRVIHRERFTFRGPGKYLAEPFLRSWLAADTRDEMLRLKAHLEAGPP
jgi:hypothetical protein